jgi:hypothetical protein
MSTLFFLKLTVAFTVSTIISKIIYNGISQFTYDEDNIFGLISGFFFICTLAAIFLTAWSWALE